MFVFIAIVFSFCAASFAAPDQVVIQELVVRQAPVPLCNPDGRCVRNALLQAMMPIIIDGMNIHAQRTGSVLTDADLIAMVDLTMNRQTMVAIALMRSALAINSWVGDEPIGTYPFDSCTRSGYYGEGARQYPLLVNDILAGMGMVTALNMAYYLLPVDRCVSDTSIDLHASIVAQIDRTHGYLPDSFVVDVSGTHVAQFDEYSLMSKSSLSLPNERAIPMVVTVPAGDGRTVTYEMVSFCNVERSGVPRTSTVVSRIGAYLRYMGGFGILPHNLLPQRHATAVVRYGDTWFVAEDTRIWEVNSSDTSDPREVGRRLLEWYPGVRVLVMYRRVSASDHRSADAVALERSPSHEAVLTLRSVTTAQLSITERPGVVFGTGSLSLGLATLSCYAAGVLLQSNLQLQERSMIFAQKFLQHYMLPYMTITLLGQAAMSFFQYGIAKRITQRTIELSEKTRGASGLYSDLSLR